MAGHSQFKNIMHRKGAQDKKRAQLFTKLGREITVAARLGGPEPDKNPRLRQAINQARSQNMPNTNIERAIKRATGSDADNYEEARYEGYGPGNVAVVVEALTDNRNRTVADVRAVFSKHGGSLGETNSVTFNFDRVGLIQYGPEAGDAETVLEAAIEAGAQDVESSEDGHDIYTEPDDLMDVREAIAQQLGEPHAARLDWRPKITTPVDEETAHKLFRFFDALEELDDVQRTAANYEIDEAVLHKLSA